MACPICGGNGCLVDTNSTEWKSESGHPLPNITLVSCKNARAEFMYNYSIPECNPDEQRRRFSMMCYIALNEPLFQTEHKRYGFIFDANKDIEVHFPVVNLARRMNQYPRDPYEKVKMSFRNLSTIYNNLSFEFHRASMLYVPLFCESLDDRARLEMNGMINFMSDLGYVQNHSPELYRITSKGWEYVHQLKQEQLRQVFIAMSFKGTDDIRSTIKHTIENGCGYFACLIDEKEHNNQIVPEMLFEISRSKFLILEISEPNFGAYYEAGYAKGLGKEVIICCRDDVFDSTDRTIRPHFDISQQSTIKWRDFTDLRERLIKRIEATLGLNK